MQYLPSRRRARRALLAAMACAAFGAQAQTFPERPITLIVPFSAGGPTDTHLRAVAEEAGKLLGKNIVLDSRPGANGTNGAAAMVRAAPDGYTLAVLPASTYRELYVNKVPYDVTTSFSYILMLSDYTFGLVVKADAPWKNWKDFAADAARRPGRINVGSTGSIGTPRIVMDEVSDLARIEINMVPYKGDADVMTAVVGGHIDAAPLSGVAVPQIEAGKLRYLTMLTPKRVKRYPDLPTLKEQGVDAYIDSPYGIVGPAGLDPARLQIIHDAFKKALESPASLKVLDQLNQSVNYMNPEEYRKYALAALAREKGRVASLRKKGLLE